MKRINAVLIPCLLACAALALTTCRNPLFSVGLGDKVDILPPGIKIVSSTGVVNGAYVHGDVTVTGEVSDDVSVASVSWVFTDAQSGLSSSPGTAPLEADGRHWNFELHTKQPTVPLYDDGEKNFVITVTDSSGKSSDTRMLLIFDNTAPTVSFTSPAEGATVYGSVTLRGSSSDNSRITGVEVRVGKAGSGTGDGFVPIAGNLYDWTRVFMSNDYNADSSQAIDRGLGDGTWDLPIYYRVYDVAGNVATNEPGIDTDPLYPDDLLDAYGADAVSFFDSDPADALTTYFSLIIDLDRNRPTLVIQMPQNNINTAGTVLVGGTCFDEAPGVATVGVQIEALDDSMAHLAWVKKDGSLTDDTWWEPATLNPSKTYWQLAINENEGLYSVNASHHGWLRISARPTDSAAPANIGNVSSLTIRLDNSIPRLENTQFDMDGAGPLLPVVAQDYLYARGTINFLATAKDDQLITSIRISLDGGTSYEEINASGYVSGSGGNRIIDYPITTLVNPAPPAAQIPPALIALKNGLLTIAVKIKDNTAPVAYESTWLVTLNMDNVYPSVTYTGDVPIQYLSGNSTGTSEVRGSSTDTGTVKSITKVEAYLVRGLNALNLAGAAGVPWANSSFGDPPALAPYTTDAACKVVIDGEYADRALTQVGADALWRATLNTTVLSDGPLDIHYVAWDSAGNSSHGVTGGYIRNDPPQIQSLTLGTDVNGNGSIGDVLSGESQVFTSGYAATGFTVRNGKLRITIDPVPGSGNGNLRYSVKYGGTAEKNGAAPLNNSVLITDFTGMPDAGVNSSRFDIAVYDSTVSDDANPANELTAELAGASALAMTFRNTDSTPPRAWLREFSNTRADMTKSDYSLWEETLLPENTVLPAGHIELRTHTLYGNGSFNPGHPGNTGVQLDDDDPEVSGKIVLRGVAWDDQRLTGVWVDVDLDGDGSFGAPETTQILQSGAGNLLVGLNGGAIRKTASGTDMQSLDLAKGHQVEWYWVLDSSLISSKARADVKVRVTAIDAAVNPSVDRLYSSATAPVAAASPVTAVAAGERYLIASPGSTTFTGLGAPDSSTGTIFTASRDGTAGDGTGTVWPESTMLYNRMTVDVVPYLRRLITMLSTAYSAKPSVFDRTAQGHYPVAENATVQVHGFNFDGAATMVEIGTTGLAAPTVPTGAPKTHIAIATGSTAVSGDLILRVAGVPAQNNSNSNAQGSNSEANGVNNDLLSDDRVLDVWKFTAIETNSAIKYPMMRIRPNAAQDIAFSYGDIESDFIIRVGAARTLYEQSPSKYAYNVLAFDQATVPNFYALALNTDRTNDGFGGSPRTGANSSTKMNFFSRQTGTGTPYPGSYIPGTYKRQLEANWNGYQYNSLRSMHPDMVVKSPATISDGNPAKVYMVYYDQILEQTKFRYGTVGADGNTMDYGLALNLDPTIATAIPKIGSAGGTDEGTVGAPLALAHSVWRTGGVTAVGSSCYVVTVEPRNTYTFVLDSLSANADLRIYSDAGFATQVASSTNAGTTTDFVDYLTVTGQTALYVRVQGVAAATYRLSYNDRGTAGNYHIVGGPQTTSKGGQYSTIGVTSGGVAVVAWYDKPNTRLMYSWNDDPASVGGNSEAQWQAHAIELDSDFSGWFVDLAVDGADAIHIAYYNSSNGDLRYILIPSYNGAASAAKTVDSFLSTGSNITIMTKLVGGNHVPYISYYCGALTATRHSMRMAWRTNFAVLDDGAGQSDSKYTGSWEITSIPATNIPKDHTVSVGFKDLGAKTLQPIAGYATEVNLETAQLK